MWDDVVHQVRRSLRHALGAARGARAAPLAGGSTPFFVEPADARNQLLELVRGDANRASVVLWGVGNENADTDARYPFMRTLAEAAREADATRLVGAACLINREHFCIEDRLAQHLDEIGLTDDFGLYEPD